MLKQLLLFFNTVKYLKFIQILTRIKIYIQKSKPKIHVAPNISTTINQLKPFIYCKQKLFEDIQFIFLNSKFQIKKLEDWNNKKLDKLWLYNLHYFDDLTSINSDLRISSHCQLIQRWIDENPAGTGIGWEPYPSSLRIVNWIKFFLINRNSKQEWLDSLANQTRFLVKNLEYHLLGNHLVANAKALIFSGLFFHGQEANKWYSIGLRILKKELSEQILADGAHFELSPMYHSIFIEDLLDIINLHNIYNKSNELNLDDKVIKMLSWLENMCHPDRKISFFNDAAFEVAPTLNQLLRYANSLEISYDSIFILGVTYLKESGYIRFNSNNMSLIADLASIGPDYLPGHAHADTLSFEMSIFGDRFIVNSGVSTYKLSSDRRMQRSTLAHSTISVDDLNSSEIWGSFRVARRAKVSNISISEVNEVVKFSATHDGYRRLNDGILHNREWVISKNCLQIIDNISGRGRHKITSVFPLHPDVVVESFEDKSVNTDLKGKKINFILDGEASFQVISGRFYPEFGFSVENSHILFNYNGNLPNKTILNISW